MKCSQCRTNDVNDEFARWRAYVVDNVYFVLCYECYAYCKKEGDKDEK